MFALPMRFSVLEKVKGWAPATLPPLSASRVQTLAAFGPMMVSLPACPSKVSPPRGTGPPPPSIRVNVSLPAPALTAMLPAACAPEPVMVMALSPLPVVRVTAEPTILEVAPELIAMPPSSDWRL